MNLRVLPPSCGRRLNLLFPGTVGISFCAMKTSFPGAASGRVASLHLHPAKPGEPLEQVDAIARVCWPKSSSQAASG